MSTKPQLLKRQDYERRHSLRPKDPPVPDDLLTRAKRLDLRDRVNAYDEAVNNGRPSGIAWFVGGGSGGRGRRWRE